MQANEPALGAGLPSLRLSRHRVANTAIGMAPIGMAPIGMALVNGAGLHAAFAQGYGGTPIQLPPVSVEAAQGGQSGYQVNVPANSKLTQPLVSTPETVIEVPRQLLNDEGVTTMRDAQRPGRQPGGR
jgi:catecholate siderophore receptor